MGNKSGYRNSGRGLIRLNTCYHLIPFIVLASLLLLNQPWIASAQATITPNRIEVTLESGACADKVVKVTLSESPIPQLDVVLVIDVTGSMSDIISEVTRSAGEIVANTRSLVPDAAFALATLADYPGGGGLFSLFTGYGGPDDYPWRMEQDFTQDEAEIQTALNQIALKDGGDAPESYLRALYETQFLSWREGSRRIVLLFGDSTPHDPDPGRDGTENTADDLTLEGVISELVRDNITVLGIYTDEEVRSFYQTVAVRTGGQSFHLSHTEMVPQAIHQLLEATIARIHTLTLRPSTAGAAWMQWQPIAYYEVPAPADREFALRLCVPEGTPGGDYNFDLTVMGDGAILGRIPVLIHVIEIAVSPTKERFPWWLIMIPLLLLPLIVLIWYLVRRRPAPAGTYTRPAPRPGGTPSSQPVHKPTSRPRGADITHGRDKPRSRA